jgi:hypothetical protein
MTSTRAARSASPPPNSADIGTKARYLATADAFYLCEQDNGKWTCEKTPDTGSADPQSAAIAAGLTGNGFISAPIFTICLTDQGILARFSGTATDGKKAKVELTKYSSEVDPSLFRPPAGATIKDTTEPTQPAPPTNS